MKRCDALFVVMMLLIGLSEISANAATPAYIHWKDRSIPNQYVKIMFGGNGYWSSNYFGITNPYTQTKETDISEIGEFIRQTVAVAGYNDFEYDIRNTVNCKVYSLKSVSARYAVAVEYEGYDGYYMFINRYYTPETLGDMIDCLGLSRDTVINRDIFLVILYRYASCEREGEPLSIRYKIPDGSAIWDLMLANTSAAGARYKKNSPHNIDFMDAHIYTGNSNGVLWISIYPDGSLIVLLPLANTMKFVGDEDTIRTFVEYVQVHGEIEEYKPPLEAEPHNAVTGKFVLWIVLGVAGAAIIAAVAVVAIQGKKRR